MRLSYGLLPAFLVACGSDATSSSGGNPPPPPAATVVNVDMTDASGLAPYAFSPVPLEIKVGTIVKWTNKGKAQHTSTSDATPPIWNSSTVRPAGSGSCDPNDPYCTPGTSPAGTYQRTFSTAGTFSYHCQFHVAEGMTGTITVTP